ncbi:MAG TPA: NADP-dependent oxidoreductase [Gaiellales bacterium]|nr:NADP-dependent oxidoreductase [Gaiellales bacterium]
MRALLVHEPGEAECLRPGEIPAPRARPGHVVVQVEAAGVNPVDAANRADPSWAAIEPPYVVGYELAGVVDELGEGVSSVAVGDRVWGLLPVRGTRWGAYAELVELREGWVTRRPSALDDVEAAAIPLAGSTALQLLDRLALGAGESLLVHGAAGGVGSLLVQLARMNGVRVAGSAGRARRELLGALGVDVILDREDADLLTVATERLGGPLDAVADLVGQGLLARSLPAIREGGRAASIVELTGDYEEAVDRNITLHGVLVSPSADTLERLAAAVSGGGLRPVVDQVFEPGAIAAAHRRLETGHGQGKLVLRMAG